MTDRTMRRVLAIPGSLRRDSFNRSLLGAAVPLAPSGMSINVYDRLGEVPVFNEDLEHPPPPGVQDLREAVARSHGIIIATPEYNQSVPGVVKNTIDWLSRSAGPDGLAGKPVAVTGVTTGPWGTRISQTMLRQMLTSTEAVVLPRPTVFLRDGASLFDGGGNLVDPETRERLRHFLRSFERWIRSVTEFENASETDRAVSGPEQGSDRHPRVGTRSDRTR